MRLLVSVASGAEAAVARNGGADVIDAKDPWGGALAPVTLDVFHDIHEAAGATPVSAALGDHADAGALAAMAAAFVDAGAAFVKAGFAGVESSTDVERLLKAGVAAVGRDAMVAVAYADSPGGCLAPELIAGAAVAAGAGGLLIDTADKERPSLFRLHPPTVVAAWIRRWQSAGLSVALAGKLAAADVSTAAALGADLAGVRGAACSGGRIGAISEARVRELKAHLAAPLAASSSASRSR